jgi:hypothetical protein
MKSLIASILLLGSGVVNATVLTFDDRSGSAPDPIEDGYAGLNWSNLRSLFGCIPYPESGYCDGTVSGYNIVYNIYARDAAVSSDSLFDFDGTYLTAAWNDQLNIQVLGFNGETLLYDSTVLVNSDEPTWFDFSYAGIDRLEFSSFGGVDADSADGGSGNHFVMDNFTFTSTVVPIPAAVWLFGSALAGLGWMRRRKTA